jgi:cyclohexa-1,5-dienecarbonyl-CoA hydratase
MTYRHLVLDAGGEVATLSLARAPANLLNIELLEELNDALLSLRSQKTLEVLILRGAAGTFSEGMDLADHSGDRVQRVIHLYMRLFETLRMMDAIEIAAVEGKAWGAGFELALGCNLFIAADNASFKLPETTYGLFPPIACAILPRVVPRRKAMEWILTGDEISAERLEHDGVINRLIPAADFERGLAEFVAQISAKSKPVLELAKRAQFEAYYSTFPEAMARVQSLYLRELMELQGGGKPKTPPPLPNAASAPVLRGATVMIFPVQNGIVPTHDAQARRWSVERAAGDAEITYWLKQTRARGRRVSACAGQAHRGSAVRRSREARSGVERKRCSGAGRRRDHRRAARQRERADRNRRHRSNGR